MSRYHTKTKNGSDVFYGFDDIVGYFYEEWGDDEAPTIELDSMFFGLSRKLFLKLLQQTDALEEHKHCVALDLPF